MLTLIRQVELFDPEPRGRRDVLVAGRSILAVEPSITLAGPELTVVEAAGRCLLPGFVDVLTHPCGGGGEGGFGNRTGELDAATFALAGVTCPIGALGTDSVTRSLEVLFGTIMGLRARGIGAFMYTGSYRLPAVTLTGEVMRDLVLIDPVIGVGEVAISDHRSSAPTVEELRRVAADARVGGVIAGKAGTILVHVGDGPGLLSPLREALAGSDLPPGTFYPTHCNRSEALLADALAFARPSVALGSNRGATIDFTVSTTPDFIAAGEVPALEALHRALDEGVPPANLTLSSDAGGSLPRYEGDVLVGFDVACPGVLLEALQRTGEKRPERLTAVLAALTANPARALGLAAKGRIAPGADADLLLVERESFALTDVLAGGRWLVRDGQAVA